MWVHSTVVVRLPQSCIGSFHVPATSMPSVLTLSAFSYGAETASSVPELGDARQVVGVAEDRRRREAAGLSITFCGSAPVIWSLVSMFQ